MTDFGDEAIESEWAGIHVATIGEFVDFRTRESGVVGSRVEVKAQQLRNLLSSGAKTLAAGEQDVIGRFRLTVHGRY